MVEHSISMVQYGFLRCPDKEIWLTKVLRNRIVHTEARVSCAKKTVHRKSQKDENYIFLIWIQTCKKSKLATSQVARYFSFCIYIELSQKKMYTCNFERVKQYQHHQKQWSFHKQSELQPSWEQGDTNPHLPHQKIETYRRISPLPRPEATWLPSHAICTQAVG